jgi:signal peptidase I
VQWGPNQEKFISSNNLKIARKRILKLGLVLVLLGVCFPVFYYFFFVSLTRVPTGAMANTIIPGDHLVVKKRAFGEIKRGDIVVFKYPKDTSVKYVFRVVGLPQETIEIRGRIIYINGKELNEERVTVRPDYGFDPDGLQELSTEGSGPYRVFYFSREEGDESGMPSDSDAGDFGASAPFQIPANEYFVLGDNRDNSDDSRYWGTVPRALVLGKPTMIYWSAHRDREGNESIRWNRVFRKISTY